MAAKPKPKANPYGTTSASGSDRHLSERTQTTPRQKQPHPVNPNEKWRTFTTSTGSKVDVKNPDTSRANYEAVDLSAGGEGFSGMAVTVSQAQLLRMMPKGTGYNKGYKSTPQTGKNKKK